MITQIHYDTAYCNGYSSSDVTSGALQA